MPHPRVVAHRGWQQGYMENSLDAIQAAIEHRCRAVEFDVRRTRDRQWVVYHDEDLMRLHGSELVIAETDYADLRQAVSIPLLDEVLSLFTDACLPMIEVKQPEAEGVDALCTIIDRYSFPRVVIARGPDLPAELVGRLPDVSVFLYTRSWEEALSRRDEVAGFDLWHESIPDLQAAKTFVHELQRNGRQVAVWTINDPRTIHHWLDLNTAWVISDRPWDTD